jgi:hypothetical protein
MDGDLLRRIREAERARNMELHRQLTLLLVMLRLACNSYEAVCFIIADTEGVKRKARYVIVLPPINRQIMDLWFTLVYMNDDFETRSLLYEKGAYRELRKQIDRTDDVPASTLEWREEMQNLAKTIEGLGFLTDQEREQPEKHIPSWPHPHGLTTKETPSRDFLKFLHDRIYADTSVESHLKPAGLMVSAGILLRDVLSEAAQERIKNRDVHVYKARRVFRTVTSLLGVISEIELRCNLNNREQAAKIWSLVAEHHPDAGAIFDPRYRALLKP